MIGLTYVRNLCAKSMQSTADDADISKQTVYKWENKKIPISKESLDKLEKIFKIPRQYFQKELDEIDKLKIQMIRMKNEMVSIEYEDTIINPATGEETSVTSVYHDANIEYSFSRMEYDISELELLNKMKNTLNTCFIDGSSKADGGLKDASNLLKLYSTFVNIVADKNINTNTVINLLNAVRVSYQQYDTDDKFIKDIAERIRMQNESEKIKQAKMKEYADMQDNDDLFS